MGKGTGPVRRTSLISLLRRCLPLAGVGVLFAGASVAAQEPPVSPTPPFRVEAGMPDEAPPALPPAVFTPPVPMTPPYGTTDRPSSLGELTPSPCGEPKKPDPPKYPTARLTGYFQLDAVYASQSTTNRQTVGASQDSLDFRRARIAAAGNVAEHITYILEFDFAALQARFADVWVTFGEVPLVGNVRIGRYRQPFGMDELTSSRELPFMERSTGFTLAPFRQSGVMLFDTLFAERATYAVSAYRYNSDPFGDVFTSNGGYGLAARLTGLPLYASDHQLVHVGADYSYNRPGGTNPLRFQSTPEIFAGGTTGSALTPNAVRLPPFVDTDMIQVDNTNLFNLEAAALHNNVMVQSEARWAVIDQGAGGGVTTLPAFYAQGRWVLTGEKFTYNKAGGVVGRVRPERPVYKGGCGAWELALRYSYIDLNGTTPPAGRPAGPGRQLNDFTVGVNWYLVDNAKFQFNYIHPMVNDRVTGTTNADFVAARCQIDF